MTFTYAKPEKISMKNHPECNENWVRDIIAADPPVLGLGDLEIKDIERAQPQGGRLDLLLKDPDSGKRYEVEIMLGTVNESHIVRCIEYWDIERKRYPQYEHSAVLIAENITTRFLNVISLFNNSIPLIAIQMEALKLDDKIILHFTKVLDEIIPGEDDEDEPPPMSVDRSYWEKKVLKQSLDTVDTSLEIIKGFDPSAQPNYNKAYIGITDGMRPRNYLLFKAKKQFVRVEAKIRDQEQWRQRLEDAEIFVFPGRGKRKRIHFRMNNVELEKNKELISELYRTCFEEWQGQ